MTDAGKFLTDLLFKTNKYGERVPANHPDKARHIHIDTSLRGDATGIACGCVYDYKKYYLNDFYFSYIAHILITV